MNLWCFSWVSERQSSWFAGVSFGFRVSFPLRMPLRVFKAFFVEMRLPYAAVRGRETRNGALKRGLLTQAAFKH